MNIVVYFKPNLALSKLGKEHWNATKWIFRYLWGSTSFVLVYGKW